jgi:predicted XRE-type DNA-binding protein
MRVDTKKIEEIRKAKGKDLNQGVIAKALDISQSNYSTKLKTGDFTDNEIDKICELLDIKKEQIELKEISIKELTFLINKSIQNESALKVILSTQAEIIAKLSNGNATKIRLDLESVVDSLSKQALEQLRQQV